MMVMFTGTPLKAQNMELKPKADGQAGVETDWFSAFKPGLKERNPFINLPYVIDGDLVVSQSNACLSYLGRKFNLWGSNVAESTRCDELLCETMDFRNKMTDFAYGKHADTKAAGAKLVSDVSGKSGSLQKFELCLTMNGASWNGFSFVGNRTTAPDFHIWEMLDQYSHLAKYADAPAFFGSFPLLEQFYTKFAALPQNAKYFASPLFTTTPFNNLSACYGSTVSGDAWSPEKGYPSLGFSGNY
jgi:glutathione S-transferase